MSIISSNSILELKFLKRNLTDNNVIFSVDFSWNYDVKQFHEIQSAYFGHKAFTLFNAACYVKGSNTDYNFKSNIDKDTSLTVIPVCYRSFSYFPRNL